MTANMYDGRCRKCGLTVLAGEGELIASSPYHVACAAEIRRGVPPETDSPPATPEPEASPEITESDLKASVEDLIAKVAEGFLATVPAMVQNEVIAASRSVEIKIGNLPKMKIDGVHVKFDDIVTCCAVQVWPLLVGPAGSGKTTIAMQIAKALKRKFYCESRVTSEYKLLGYMDATGKYVRTQIREAYEKGGAYHVQLGVRQWRLPVPRQAGHDAQGLRGLGGGEYLWPRGRSPVCRAESARRLHVG
jgi:hypothetical protein